MENIMVFFEINKFMCVNMSFGYNFFFMMVNGDCDDENFIF